MARFQHGNEVFDITSADPRYTTEQRRRLCDGWTRVPDLRCEVPLGGEAIEPVLEAALRAEPRDPATALVYADWLEQQGHPRGALIAVQHRLATSPRDATLVAAERAIVDDAGDSLLSKPLRAHFGIVRTHGDSALSSNHYVCGTLTFDHGFIRSARVALDRHGADEDVLWELLRHPSARALAALDLTADHTRDISLVVALLVHGPRPPLRALAVAVDRRNATVDLAGLDAAYPDLEDLSVEITGHRLGGLALPRLARLAIDGEHSDIGRLLGERTWPALHELTLALPCEDYVEAFAEPRFPALRALALHRPHDAASDGLLAVRMLVRSPDVRHVERLALGGLTLRSEAVDMLVAQRARFAALSSLTVTANIATVARLRDAGFPVHKREPKNGTR
ncbi:MAG TPA: TIGR02996 domain-containing protein [Kofleriaceae bacterium]|nr:TIGR02996 domain-containing protein [Kofleriaceae bacterium]